MHTIVTLGGFPVKTLHFLPSATARNGKRLQLKQLFVQSSG